MRMSVSLVASYPMPSCPSVPMTLKRPVPLLLPSGDTDPPLALLTTVGHTVMKRLVRSVVPTVIAVFAPIASQYTSPPCTTSPGVRRTILMSAPAASEAAVYVANLFGPPNSAELGNRAGVLSSSVISRLLTVLLPDAIPWPPFQRDDDVTRVAPRLAFGDVTLHDTLFHHARGPRRQERVGLPGVVEVVALGDVHFQLHRDHEAQRGLVPRDAGAGRGDLGELRGLDPGEPQERALQGARLEGHELREVGRGGFRLGQQILQPLGTDREVPVRLG